MKKIILKNSGFTLFVALIVTSLLLAITFSLSDIILKQLVFSQSARESQISFYAADSGAECALFWDRKNQFGSTTAYGAFATSTELGTTGGPFYDLYCGYGGSGSTAGSGVVGSFSKTLQNGGIGPNVFAATTTFYVDFQDADTGSLVSGQKGACAKVTVEKWVDNSIFGAPVERTVIDSRGYDVPLISQSGALGLAGSPPVWNSDSDCDVQNDRVIERAIRIEY